MLCALGITQLKSADDGLAKRRIIAEKYNKAFSNNSNMMIQPLSMHVGHAFHLLLKLKIDWVYIIT